MSNNAVTIAIIAALFGCIAACSFFGAWRDRGVAKSRALEARNRRLFDAENPEATGPNVIQADS